MSEPQASETSERAYWKAFGDWVKARREDGGFSKAEAARWSEVSASTWSNIEAGGRIHRGEWVVASPSDRVLARLAGPLQVSVKTIFDQLGRPVPAWLEAERVSRTDAAVERRRLQLSALSGKIDQLSPVDRRYVEDLVERLLGEAK